jgi:hypothetical protein
MPGDISDPVRLAADLAAASLVLGTEGVMVPIRPADGILVGRTHHPAPPWFGWARNRPRHGPADGVLAGMVVAFEDEDVPDTARNTLMVL